MLLGKPVCFPGNGRVAAAKSRRPALKNLQKCRIAQEEAKVKTSLQQPKQSVAEESCDDPEECVTFIDRDGNLVEAMCCDYGFRTGAMRMYSDDHGRIPKSFLALGIGNFKKEYAALRRSFQDNEYATISEGMGLNSNPIGRFFGSVGGGVVNALSAADRTLVEQGLLRKLEQLPEEVTNDQGELVSECAEIRAKLKLLRLDNQAVWDRERGREQVKTAWPIAVAYNVVCWLLDVVFDQRPLARFWTLETVARMPYFSYMSVLHLYETLGWYRAAANLRQVHAAEEWNELHHLQIMESLGGDRLWIDRFIALHAAVVYYWILVVLYLLSPQQAYAFSEKLEAHAVDTYGQFLDENEKLLKSLPPPLVALQYYRTGDLYYFDAFQTGRAGLPPRRPEIRNLYDVFGAIADDEGEHVKTMAACQDSTIGWELQARMEAEMTEEQLAGQPQQPQRPNGKQQYGPWVPKRHLLRPKTAPPKHDTPCP